ncbi:MAG: two-component regulator [Alphaproteobacteria bacterium]|nr:two-component regulator [Alphaproteobacteria bacterium]MDB5722700.1 two-component regulator [Alphaproteobacteria bacterium]
MTAVIESVAAFSAVGLFQGLAEQVVGESRADDSVNVGRGRLGILSVVVYSPVRLFADGVAACLDAQDDTRAVACHDIQSLRTELASGRVDMVLVDVTDGRALEQGRALIQAFPRIKAVALALPEAAEDVIACADAGFVSYVPRNACAEDMREVLRRALKDEVFCDPKVSGSLLRELRRRQAMRAPASEPEEELTRREREVLGLLGRRMSNKEIARQLCLSTATVKNHVHAILTKLNVHARSEALARLQADPMIGDCSFAQR